jgi:hypothetical protein
MPRWIVEGADATTGREFSTTVDAESETAATGIAREGGMLVARIRRDPNTFMPDYPDLVRSGRALRGWAGLFTILGCVCLVAFLVCVALVGIGLAAKLKDPAADVGGLAIFGGAPLFVTMMGWISCFAMASLLRWSGAVGSALRDIARHTYRP